MAFGFTDPWREMQTMMNQMNRLSSNMDRMFGSLGGPSTLGSTFDTPMLTDTDVSSSRRGGIGSELLPYTARSDITWFPRMDVRESGKDLVVSCELPGMKKDDIKVDYNNGLLNISGERKHEDVKEGDNWYRKERSVGKFWRSLRVPENVKDENIKASFDNGVLELKLENAAEQQPEKKAITIQ